MVNFSAYKARYPYLEERECLAIEQFFGRSDIVDLLARLEVRRKKTVLAVGILPILGITTSVVLIRALGWYWPIALIASSVGIILLFRIGKFMAEKIPLFGRLVGFEEESIKETLLPEFVRAMGKNFRYASSPGGFSHFREMNTKIATDPRTWLIIEWQSPEALEISGNIADTIDRIAEESRMISKEYSDVFAEDSVQQFITTPDMLDGRGGILLESVEIEMKSWREGKRKCIDHCFLTKIELNNPRFSFGEGGVLVESTKRNKDAAMVIVGITIMIVGVLMLFGYWNTVIKGSTSPLSLAPSSRLLEMIWPLDLLPWIEITEARGRSSGGGSRSSGSRGSSSFHRSTATAIGTAAALHGINTATGQDNNPAVLLILAIIALLSGGVLTATGLWFNLTKLGARKIGRIKLQPLTIDNPEFQKQYKTYAQDPALAMKILTNDFTWRILDFSKQLGKNSVYHFFFRENTIWVKYDLLLSGVNDFMEFSLWKNMEKNVASYIEFFLEVKAVTSFAEEWNIFQLDAGMMQSESIQGRLSSNQDTVFAR